MCAAHFFKRKCSILFFSTFLKTIGSGFKQLLLPVYKNIIIECISTAKKQLIKKKNLLLLRRFLNIILGLS